VRASLAASTSAISARSFLSRRAASSAACSSVMSSLEAPVRWHEEVKFKKHLLGEVIIILVIGTDSGGIRRKGRQGCEWPRSCQSW
jgi:hypothetical protein